MSKNQNDVVEKGQELASDASELIEEVKETASGVGQRIKEHAYDTGQLVKQKASSGQEQLLELIHAHPYKSLGVAFAAGMLLAKCCKWKS